MRHFLFVTVLSMVLFIAVPVAFADSEGPTVGEVSPLTAVYEIPETFYVEASDAGGVASCTLVVSSVYETVMSYNADLERWEAEYTFGTDRSANSIRAKCSDSDGNETTGDPNVISVSEAPMETGDGESEDTGDENGDVDATTWDEAELIAASPVLIKTACPGGEDATHTCRTVYFLDDDGLRHAFPNERAYFTWYENYDDLHLITSEMMASFSLGKNVTYHPGTRMVKFPLNHTVYVVARYGVLRAVSSEELASDLYGDNWNEQIDDISEAFYGNYTIGDDVADADDFNAEAEEASVDSFNDSRAQMTNG